MDENAVRRETEAERIAFREGDNVSVTLARCVQVDDSGKQDADEGFPTRCRQERFRGVVTRVGNSMLYVATESGEPRVVHFSQATVVRAR